VLLTLKRRSKVAANRLDKLNCLIKDVRDSFLWHCTGYTLDDVKAIPSVVAKKGVQFWQSLKVLVQICYDGYI